MEGGLCRADWVGGRGGESWRLGPELPEENGGGGEAGQGSDNRTYCAASVVAC